MDRFAEQTPMPWGGFKITGIRNEAILQEGLDLIMIRRKREDVIADLPPKLRYTYSLEMLSEQKELYKK